MKPYGMSKQEADDLDATSCRANGRATHLYRGDGRAYRGLRGGKKAAARRIHKRRARAEGHAIIREDIG